jgi:sulfur carrier protein
MKILINGVEREMPAGTTIAQLLVEIGAPQSGVAVARNDAVVRRPAFASARLETGDRVEIIKAVAGG